MLDLGSGDHIPPFTTKSFKNSFPLTADNFLTLSQYPECLLPQPILEKVLKVF